MPRNFQKQSALKWRKHCCFNEAAADAAEFLETTTTNRTKKKGFNEAAADAAEFSNNSVVWFPFQFASMRPRQMPRNFIAEDGQRHAHADASMRPRQMPRNFGGRGARRCRDLFASMRPRQMPRNFPPRRTRAATWTCFNEAAADAAEFYSKRLANDGIGSSLQ